MNRFRSFMYGRYGLDQFTQFILWISIIATFLGSLTGFFYLNIISYVLLIIAIFRTLSKNINQRTKENLKYVNRMNSIKGKIQKFKTTIFGTKTHRYYLCPKCKQTIRVPKGKGKICITCPKCRTEFIKRT